MGKFVGTALRIAVSFVALANAIWILVPARARTGIESNERTVVETRTEARLVVPSESMKYDGKGGFDPLKGVAVTDGNGVVRTDAPISYEVESGKFSNDREKIVRYEAEADGNVMTAERRLSLGTSYSGPSVTATDGSLPWCREGEIESYADVLRATDAVECLDGFGNDVSESLEANLIRYDEKAETAVVSLSVKNEFGDETAEEFRIPMNESGVVLVMKGTKATIEKGTEFDPNDFVARLEYEYAADGSPNATPVVELDGDVDVSTPGTYEVRVLARTKDGKTSKRKKLTVEVVDGTKSVD